MADIPFDLAIAVGTQTALGTPNPTISGLAGALNAAAHGIVSGDPETGIGEKGIDVKWARELKENAKLANFTTQASSFLREAVDDLSVGWFLKGNGNVLSGAPADAEFALDPGIDALLQGLGLVSADWSGGIGKIYTPAPAKYLTVKLWVGLRASSPWQLAWVFQDCVATGKITFTPAGIGQALAELSVGAVTSFGEVLGGSPTTFDYQEQTTVSAPVVQGVAHAWGVARGFQKFELGVENEIEELDDSNQPTGVRQRFVDRAITASAELYADDSDFDFERAELVRGTAPTNLMSFTVPNPAPDATPTATGQRMRAYRVRLTTPELRALAPLRIGDLLGWSVDLTAVSGVANGDFELILL